VGVRSDEESQTAVLVCAGRAAAHGRTPVPAFSDPTAEVLLPADTLARVRAYRADPSRPTGARARLEHAMLRATEALMVPRTVAIDEAVRESPAGQLVILGAGLDGRAWRLPELAGTVVFEVDHPASQQAKRARVAQLPVLAGEVRFVPVDFAHDDLDARLAEAGHDPAAPTTWVWEGVVPYLTSQEIQTTLAVLASRSAPGSRLVISYVAPSLVRYLGRWLSRLLLRSGSRDVLGDEPQRSFFRAPALRTLLAGYGFTVVRDQDLVDIARSLSADTTAMGPFPRAGRVAVAQRSS
jgi:methyltransferase (TIGR00027 family)